MELERKIILIALLSRLHLKLHPPLKLHVLRVLITIRNGLSFSAEYVVSVLALLKYHVTDTESLFEMERNSIHGS